MSDEKRQSAPTMKVQRACVEYRDGCFLFGVLVGEHGFLTDSGRVLKLGEHMEVRFA